MGKNTYNIGQVVYVVTRKERKVVPVQVIKESVAKTREGVEVTYTVQNGPDGSSQVELDNVDGEVFSSLDEVNRTLFERAKAGIQRLTDTARAAAQEWYGVNDSLRVSRLPDLATAPKPERKKRSPKARDEAPPPAAESAQLGAVQRVTLDDGTIAKVRLPPELLAKG